MIAQIIKIERKYAMEPVTLPKTLRVFLPYDGSKTAEACLEFLSGAGLPDQLEALIAVTQVWLPLSPDEITSAVSARRLKLLSSGLSSHVAALQDHEEQRVLSLEAERKLRSMFPKGVVRTEAIQDTAAVAQAILRKAKRWRADLIILASNTSPSSQITDYAGPAIRVAQDAHCSVRIARPSQPKADCANRIIICVDGSSSSRDVINAASERSWPTGTTGSIVVVQKPGSRRHTVRDTQVLNTWADTLRATGLEVSSAMADGEPKEVLLLRSRDPSVNCLFIGPHLGFPDSFEATGLSETAAAIILGAQCSVEVVRPHS